MSKPTDIRYTPASLIEPVRHVLGSIDLDPASSTQANETVRARRIFTEEDNGLEQEWHGNVWLNWPASKALKFALKLDKELKEGRVQKAAVMLFNWDHSTQWFETLAMLNPTYVLFRNRIKFPDASGQMYEVGRSQAIAFIAADADQALDMDVRISNEYRYVEAYIL